MTNLFAVSLPSFVPDSGLVWAVLALLPLFFMFGLLPDQTDVHVDSALTNFAQKFLQTSGFVFDKVFTSLPVKHASDKYYTYARDDFWRDQGDGVMLLADGAPVKRGGYRMSTGTYSCDVRAFGHGIPKGRKLNADAVINSEQDAVDFVTQQLMVRLEAQFMTEFLAGSIWGTTSTLSGTTQWSDYDDSDPVAAVDTAMQTIGDSTGMTANTFLCGSAVDLKLKRHPVVQSLYKVTNVDSITDEMMARVLGVERYLVAKAVKATNIEGASAAFARIAAKKALLCYVAPAGTEGATAGKVFKWDGWGNGDGIAIQSRYDEDTREDVVEGFIALDFKVTSTALGYEWEDAVA